MGPHHGEPIDFDPCLLAFRFGIDPDLHVFVQPPLVMKDKVHIDLFFRGMTTIGYSAAISISLSDFFSSSPFSSPKTKVGKRRNNMRPKQKK